MIAPTPRLLASVALVALPLTSVAAIPGWTARCYAVLGGALLLALIDLLRGQRALDGLEAQAPEVVRFWKDREAALDLTIRNRGMSARTVRIGLPLPNEIATAREDQFVQLPAGVEFARVPWPCTARRRGRYLIDACFFEARSPLQLWAIRKAQPLTLELRVYPNVAAERKRSAANMLKRGQAGLHVHRQIGKGREFEKLRDYSPGDGFDEVDWKATARRGKPITRVFQIERTQEVYVVLDASRLSARTAADDGETILERNLNAALLLALAAEKQGDLFGLVTFSDRVHNFVRARAGKSHYNACREALYTLEPRIVTPDLDEVCSLLRLRLRRRALIVFLTELDDPALAESFVRNVNLLRRRHVVLAGMLEPKGAEPLFRGVPAANADDVYARLAGHLRWSKLRALAKVLERQGVQFSLLQPETLARELASAYLNVKRRQLL